MEENGIACGAQLAALVHRTNARRRNRTHGSPRRRHRDELDSIRFSDKVVLRMDRTTILAPVAATIIQAVVSQSREFAADATGAWSACNVTNRIL